MENSNQFWQFSDDLRLQTNNLANLSLNDSIWSTNYAATKRVAAEERRNFDYHNGNVDPVNDLKPVPFTNEVWKVPMNDDVGGGNYNNYPGYGSGLNGGFNKGIYPTPSLNFNSYSKGKGFANNVVLNGKVNKSGRNEDAHFYGGGKLGN